MILPDVNVLVYALRQDMPQHPLCRAWLDRVINGEARFALSRLVLSAVIRLTTDRRIFARPDPLADVLSFCDVLLSRPNCSVIEPGERHWDIFTRLLKETDTRGPRVTDVWFAALAIEWGCEWITLDRDYARFPGLKWGVPSAPAA